MAKGAIHGVSTHQCVAGLSPEAQSKPARPLLRWAGSKRRLLHELTNAVPPKFSRYIEPFAGSACLFFHLQPKCAILGDINSELMDFYRIASFRPNAVLRSAIHYNRTRAGYYSARSNYLIEKHALKRVSLFFFLNHFCFNGIFRTNTKGQFNVPFGTRMGAFPTFEEFRSSARLLRRATLSCSDFEGVLQHAKEGDFVYMDPPYVYRTRKDRGEYGPASFSLIDIPRLHKSLESLHLRHVKFLLSYLDCEEVKPIRRDFSCKTVPVSRTVAGLAKSRQVVDELLIRNY
jgi:DNA adenine methylase